MKIREKKNYELEKTMHADSFQFHKKCMYIYIAYIYI